MIVNGVAKVADPKGNVRYSMSHQKNRMGFLPTGALLKISADESEFLAKPGHQLFVPISIDRSEKLTEPIKLELCSDDSEHTVFVAEPQTLPHDISHSNFTITATPSASSHTEHHLKIRATLLKDGSWPVISETSVLVELVD